MQDAANGGIIPDVIAEWLDGNQTKLESTAMLAQDLFPDTDDSVPADVVGSYLAAVAGFASGTGPHPTINSSDSGSPANYEAPSVFQYWGERFGPQGEPNVDQRVADFLDTLITTHQGGQQYDYSEALGGDALSALRDYYLAHYALGKATNISTTQNAAYAILDAQSGPAYLPLYPITVTLPDTVQPLTVPQWSGTVYELTFPPDTTSVDLQLASGYAGDFATAVVPIRTDDSFVLDPDLFYAGPFQQAPISVHVPTVGIDRIAVVLANGTWRSSANFQLTAAANAGQVGMQFEGASAQEIGTPTSGPVVLNVIPNVDGVPVTAVLPRSAFDLQLGSVHANITSVDRGGDAYRIIAWAPADLAAGTYPMTLAFGGSEFTVPGDLTIDQAAPPRWSTITAGRTAALSQGQSATAQADITLGASQAVFHAAWSGSTFDLTLTSPGGRVITSDSTDADVTVTRTPTSIAIGVTGPEAGSWTLRTDAVDVPAPEAVDYQVTEADAPLDGSLSVDDQGQAGLPLQVHFAFGEPAAAITDAHVVATVTDPLGTVRHFTLRDDGGHADASGRDGVYGGLLWATDLPGTYDVAVSATGTTTNSASVQRWASTEVTLGAKVDTDGDGIADAAELMFGLDPNDPSDGAGDLDGDGLTNAQELAAGCDPEEWDTDGAGENDASELAAGRECAFADDDATTDGVGLNAVAVDGNLVSVSVSTASGAGTVQLYRLSGGDRVDLGSFDGGGTTFQDGPLADGEYSYLAVAVTAAGAGSAPRYVGPVTVASDVTPPDFRITLNSGDWDADNPNVSVTFTDLTEPTAEMRLALSEDDLASASWVPYSPFASITVPSDLGQHFVYAQVRDAAGNESHVASSFVFLIDDTPPISQAGPLNAQYSTPTIDVPYTASDDLSGIASVALWWRYSADGGTTWTSWIEGPLGSPSPISFTFPSGPGNYEFFTVATDVSGNVEGAPTSADATTAEVTTAATLTYVTDDVLIGASPLCDPCIESPSSPGGPYDSVRAEGTATSSGGAVAVEYRLTHINGDGSQTLIRDWTAAVPSDGAFDSPTEDFRVHVTAPNSFSIYGPDSDRLELRATADGVATTATELLQPVPNHAAPASQAGPLDPVSTGTTVSVPFTAEDDHLGPVTVELWARYRSSEAAPWSAFAKVASGTSSPFTYSFASGDGLYEFALVAEDESGNRETPDPPTAGDAATLRDAVDDPPEISASLAAVRSGGTVTLTGGGVAADDRSVVSVRWRLYGVKNNGSETLLRDWSAASPDNGAFDERVEAYSIADSRSLSGSYGSYQVDMEVTANAVTTSESYAVPIE